MTDTVSQVVGFVSRAAPGALAGAPITHVIHNRVYPDQRPSEGTSPGRHGEAAVTRCAEFWGRGFVQGRITIKGAPVARRVRLFDALTGLLVGQAWSQPDGHYRFDFMDPARDYLVLSDDYQRQFNAVIADGVRPEIIAYP
jgi:hypothetical protein